MPKMLWFGLLVVVGLLLSFTGFLDADAVPEEDTHLKPPDEDNSETKTKLIFPEKIVIPHLHEGLEIKHVEQELVQPDIVFEERKVEEDHEHDKVEAVEHMQQVAEDSIHEIQEAIIPNGQDLTAEGENGETDKPEPFVEEQGDVVEGMLVDKDDAKVKDEDRADDISGTEDADEKKKKEAMSRVELLRRSDRGRVEAEENTTKSKRVYIKVVPPLEELFEFAEFEDDDEKERVAHEVVFIDSESHAHVVHKNTHYPRRVQHDEM